MVESLVITRRDRIVRLEHGRVLLKAGAGMKSA